MTRVPPQRDSAIELSERQKRRGELARRALLRREFIDRVKAANVYRCGMVEVSEHREDGSVALSWRPAIWERLRDAGISWGQVARDDPKRLQIIYFEGVCPPGVDMERNAGRIEDTSIVEQLVPDLTPGIEPVGHLSYAHTTPAEAAYTFDTDYNPFGDDPNWTHTREGTVENAISTNGYLYGGSSNVDAYVKDTLNPMASPDYSVAGKLTYNSGWECGLCVRQLVGYRHDPGYWLFLTNARFDLCYLQRSDGGPTVIASFGDAKANGTVCRIECVGTVLKAYHDGENEILSASDATLSAAGAAGAFADYKSRVDDFQTFIADAGIARPKVGGSLAAGRVGLIG